MVDAYYETYQERSDFQQLLSFYAEEVVLEDIILGERIVGKAALAEFFDWENPAFAIIDEQALVITSQIITDYEVVTKGYFTPFKWGDSTFEAMHFTTLLTFNEAGEIIKQVDWINYPNNLLDYDSRKNANTWIVPK